MQFALVFSLFFLVSTVAALPSGHVFMRQSCDIFGCVEALAPTVGSCVTAAAAEGENVSADASCLGDAVKLAINFPASCNTCLTQFGIPDAIDSAATAVESAVGDAVDSVEDAASSVAASLGSIF